jgi:hypothetical protein
MTPNQLIGPASRVGNSRETFHKSGIERRYGAGGEEWELRRCI